MLSKALFKSLVKLKIHKKVPLKRHLERMATVMLTYKGHGPAHGCVVCLMCNLEGILVIRKQNTVNAESTH